MAKIKMIFLSIALVAVLPFSALAGNFIQLGESKKASSVQALGYTPKKKKSELKLGNLRTDEAKLPSKKLTLTGRMKMRAKQALKRQNALSRTKKRPSHESSRPSDDEDLSRDYEESTLDYSDNDTPSTPTPVVE